MSMANQVELVEPRSAEAETIWRTLQQACRPAYFLTWGWISNWLAMLPDKELPMLAVIREAREVTGAFFLRRRRVIRHGVVPSRAAFVNTTGRSTYDELCIEHNAILGAACSLAKLIALLPADWDELFLPAVDGAAFCDLAVPAGFRVRVEQDVASPFVDLAKVRAAGDYLTLLSANTRSQIRKARRHIGSCELEIAASHREAAAIHDELVELHTASWAARGERGAFAEPWFDEFHRRLIAQRWSHGEIQLVRLRAGGATVGCLYNLVVDGRIAFYQSGLASFADPSVKPGLLCHAAAIEHAAAAGHETYDFLAGNARYKASLATDATRLAWLWVANEITTVFEYDRWTKARASIYILDGAQCTGAVVGAKGPCDRACALLWHEDWLILEPALDPLVS